ALRRPRAAVSTSGPPPAALLRGHRRAGAAASPLQRAAPQLLRQARGLSRLLPAAPPPAGRLPGARIGVAGAGPQHGAAVRRNGLDRVGDRWLQRPELRVAAGAP